MKIVMVSNFYNHHQRPWFSELGKLAEVRFVETEALPAERAEMGYKNFNDDIVIKAYLDDSHYNLAIQEINSADVVVFGSCPFEMVKDRLDKNKLTFRYSERLLRKSFLLRFHPNLIRYVAQTSTKYKNNRYYLLSAGYFSVKDYNSFGAFINKGYKWGYFPECPAEREKPTNSKVSLLWCGRLLALKHSEYAVEGFKYLLDKGVDAELTIIGQGERYGKLMRLAEKLGVKDKINYIPKLPFEEVQDYMIKADIFMFTSSKFEGWGAVVNESMSAECAVIMSNKIGSGPYLIKDGKSGMIYKNKRDFKKKLLYMAQNPLIVKEMGKEARKTIVNEWSPYVVGTRFYALCEALLNGQDVKFESGALSKTNG